MLFRSAAPETGEFANRKIPPYNALRRRLGHPQIHVRIPPLGEDDPLSRS